MTGCRVSWIISTIAPIPPLSSRPNTLSASSKRISLRPPSRERTNSPVSVKVCKTAPRVATLRIDSALRLSEAFISTALHPISFPRASAALVLPMPGSPWRMTARLSGRPLSQAAAHFRSSATAVGFPTISSRVLGRYFSAQPVIGFAGKVGCVITLSAREPKTDGIVASYVLFSCYMIILENIRGTLIQLSSPFPERSYWSHSSTRNSSYVFRNFKRYRRSRVCVVSWIVVSCLIRFATEISADHSVRCTHSTMCCQDAAPAAPIAVRITECEWNQGTGGDQIARSTGTFDKLSARAGERG